MFNPDASIQELPLFDGHVVLVIDNALLAPERWLDWAKQAQAQGLFQHGQNNAYPGVELPMPEQVCSALDAFFVRFGRQRLGARRTLQLYSRLALVTLQPDQLQPRQWLCHRDRLDLPADQCAVASVLYLFQDSSLGGTNFFRPRKPITEVERMVHDSGHLSASEFSARYDIAPGYMNESNSWFERVLNVEPRWNRLLFYRGELFHSSHIPHPELLSADPARGRLCLNGFFSCRRGLRV
ncbi:DUF6445 family protein [Pseudomarimonas arenosa]|uniref:Uncharacterized protein n=1 Tax=Pseudomarimonas arenosa TaxID=2774145 RepID=A0AAW3ZT81_9GAMM|nr:DUF6445 family protein [Pseudomarimonas arenosa]MBD8527366.1 hypothetical protein [Pseudomarimonas arenosa]